MSPPDRAIARAEARRIRDAVPDELVDIDECVSEEVTGWGQLRYQFSTLAPAADLAKHLGLTDPVEREVNGALHTVWETGPGRGYSCHIRVVACTPIERVAVAS